MPITLSTAKSLAQNPGLHRDPFIRPDLLLFGFDFRDPAPAVWKVGLVSGQVATAKDFNAGSPIVSDAQWSAHPSGVGISLTQSGLLTYNFNMPAFNNTDGIRRTFLAAIGAPWAQDGKLNVGLTLGAAGVFTMEIFSTNAQNALAVAYSNPLGPGLQITSHTGHSCLFVLTGNGDGTWTFSAPTTRGTDYTISDATFGFSSSVAQTGAKSGAIFNALTYINPVDLFQLAIFSGLSAAELDQQIRLTMTRFRDVLES